MTDPTVDCHGLRPRKQSPIDRQVRKACSTTLNADSPSHPTMPNLPRRTLRSASPTEQPLGCRRRVAAPTHPRASRNHVVGLVPASESIHRWDQRPRSADASVRPSCEFTCEWFRPETSSREEPESAVAPGEAAGLSFDRQQFVTAVTPNGAFARPGDAPDGVCRRSVSGRHSTVP
jgi:hypothetical protein